jgi:hypothetical protein
LADVRAQFTAQTDLYNKLKRSAGLLEAQTIISVPAYGGEYQSPIDKFNNIKGPAEKTAFYNEHRSELSRFINVPSPQL